MPNETTRITELSSEQIARAMSWWQAHEAHVGRLIAGTRTAYPPSGLDCFRPELWKDAHWHWLANKAIDEAIGSAENHA